VFVVVDSLSGAARRHRVRRGLGLVVGAVLVLAGAVAMLPLTFYVSAVLVLSIVDRTPTFGEVDAQLAIVLAGSAVVAVVCWRLGVPLIRGRRHLVLFLRRFGFTSATEALSFAVGGAVGRHWRMVTLDDHNIAPQGVARGSRWTIRLFRLALVAGAITLTVLAVRWLSGDAVDNLVDDMYESARSQAVEEGQNPIGAAIGALFVTLIVGIVVVMFGLLVFLVPMALAGVGAVLFSIGSRAVRNAERSKAIVISRHGDVERKSRLLVRRVRRVFAPRITVARVTDEFWQETVRRLAAMSAVVLVDVSEPSDNLLWEVGVLEDAARRWIPIGRVDRLEALTADPSPPANRLRQVLDRREVVGYRVEELPAFSEGLRQSLHVASAS
jgi:hypothetical protein